MKNKLKFDLETGKIYQDNINTYLKKFIRRDMNLNDDFESYVRQIPNRVTNDKYDIYTINASKFLLYSFNNFRQSLGLLTYMVRHTIISMIMHWKASKAKVSRILLEQ